VKPSRPGGPPIDRRALVGRHDVRLTRADALSPLSVGNGEFAFTADITGLQTFPDFHTRVPLCTQSQWGWHTEPPPAGCDPAAFRLRPFDTGGRPVGYPTDATGQETLFRWLRENPHRLHLGRVALDLAGVPGCPAGPDDLADVHQVLDLWRGVLESRFTVGGAPVCVTTCVHPYRDTLAVRVRSPLLADGRLGLRLAFPYGSPRMDAADWTGPERHRTDLASARPDGAVFLRRLDADEYRVAAAWAAGGVLMREGAHMFRLRPAPDASTLDLVCTFTPGPGPSAEPSCAEVLAASGAHWEAFWSTGGALDLSAATDPRAEELERRVVLSQYLTAIHCAGSLPPQETGLLCNSWYGKFHLEMHPWHALHFPLWGRPHLMERSLPWYRAILPAARATARAQGYAGARWPKMVGPEGRDSPSPVGPLLIWQQPHPILFAEMCFRERPTRETLERYAEVVAETAAFMASFPAWDQAGNRYVLGPPVIPAQENHPPLETWNPTYELAYWRHALEIAQRWRRRLGLAREPRWDHVLEHLSALPVAEGVYLAHENCPQTYTGRNRDHPSMLCAYGVLPGAGVDRATMRATLHRVLRDWRWDQTWGWDYPVVAMAAARLGEPRLAVDALLLETPKNTYLRNGHNWQRDNLPAYLPGNGGLLAAVALMAAGWEGAGGGHAPGFPADGTWAVRWEGLRPWL